MTQTLQSLADAFTLLGKTTTKGMYGPQVALTYVSGDTLICIYESAGNMLQVTFSLNDEWLGNLGFDNSCDPARMSSCIDHWLAFV